MQGFWMDNPTEILPAGNKPSGNGMGRPFPFLSAQPPGKCSADLKPLGTRTWSRSQLLALDATLY